MTPGNVRDCFRLQRPGTRHHGSGVEGDQLGLEAIAPRAQEQQPQAGDMLHIGEIWSCIRDIECTVGVVYLQEVDGGVEPLAVDHGAVPDGGETLGGAEHQGVLHPHTGQYLNKGGSFVIDILQL